MLNNAPPGTLGMAASRSWSNAKLSVKFLKHFISIVKLSLGTEVLLLMDNHESHLSPEAINLAKETGIIILTFPPHTSHKLQPLDRTAFDPMKTHYNNACRDWMLSSPRKTVSIYDVSALMGRAFPLVFTTNNKTAGFRFTGSWPFNEEVFREDELLPAEMTKKPYPGRAGEIQSPE
ncbi:MFS-type transporter clz9-like [Schistocerca piceifrons]|uniref:MFS-type transporter clz9-like n=1 Tax=Schistocerca piceifrons TaxID=274613 RepID=UPI001F5EA5DF|nr:MFS-type transporter clz9-like [Schistocerca piceifrons]